jgi:hypothetical protein
MRSLHRRLAGDHLERHLVAAASLALRLGGEARASPTTSQLCPSPRARLAKCLARSAAVARTNLAAAIACTGAGSIYVDSLPLL